MRAWLVIALVGCGHERPTKPELQTHDRTGSATVSAADAMGPDDDGVGRRIADELVALPSNRLVYLLDLGWIEIKSYNAHEGRNPQTGSAVHVPAKRLPFWTTAPDLAAEVAHQPAPPHPAAWRDERGRYMAAIHDGDQNPPGEDPDLDVVRPFWSDKLADRVHRELLTTNNADIPHVGHLAIADARVTFATSPELEQRLNSR